MFYRRVGKLNRKRFEFPIQFPRLDLKPQYILSGIVGIGAPLLSSAIDDYRPFIGLGDRKERIFSRRQRMPFYHYCIGELKFGGIVGTSPPYFTIRLHLAKDFSALYIGS